MPLQLIGARSYISFLTGALAVAQAQRRCPWTGRWRKCLTSELCNFAWGSPCPSASWHTSRGWCGRHVYGITHMGQVFSAVSLSWHCPDGICTPQHESVYIAHRCASCSWGGLNVCAPAGDGLWDVEWHPVRLCAAAPSACSRSHAFAWRCQQSMYAASTAVVRHPEND
jgi:hypothetical protein